jgi:hypothetical protein
MGSPVRPVYTTPARIARRNGPNALLAGADCHHRNVGHVRDGVAHAFMADAALPVATMGHMIGAEDGVC